MNLPPISTIFSTTFHHLSTTFWAKWWKAQTLMDQGFASFFYFLSTTSTTFYNIHTYM